MHRRAPKLNSTPPFAVLSALVLAAVAPAAYAQEAKPAAKPVLMPEVVTSATRTERDSFDLPVAIDSVDKSVIRRKTVCRSTFRSR